MNEGQLEMVFDGVTYDHVRDSHRLGTQLESIRDFMEGRGYVTLKEVEDYTGYPQASISAQIRNLRKDRFGKRTISREHISGGLYKYKLEAKTSA